PENIVEKEKQNAPAPETIAGQKYYVSPSGDNKNNGLSSDLAFKTIQEAIDQAQPGDTIEIADGEYRQDIVSKRDGAPDRKIVLEGSTNAVVKGDGGAHIVEINHSFLTLRGFTVDGLFGDSKSSKGYRDKLIYIQGMGNKKGVEGLLIENMTVQNSGGECIRMRYFATKNEISHNTIRNCGVNDFLFSGGGKNGEGVYLGTAPEQRGNGKNPTNDPDISENNWIHDNTFDTAGNECVDIKEGATRNIVEKNSCTGQKDKNSGGMDSRGNENVFRYNQIFGNKGAGIRLGGDNQTDGINNFIYGNTIKDNASGGIKVEQKPQAKMCQNTFSGNKGADFVGSFGKEMKKDFGC